MDALGIRKLLRGSVLVALLAFGLSSAFGCGSWRDDAAEKLEANLKLWNQNGFQHYRFEFRLSCMCLDNDQPFIVEVWNGLQVAATQSDGTPVAPEYLHRYYSIEGIFDYARRSLDEGADVVKITYDPQLKFPSEVFVDPSTSAYDDQGSILASNVENLPVK